MNLLQAIAAITLLGSLFASAQDVNKDPHTDPVLDAIREFNKRDEKKSSETTVVLDPVGEPPAPVSPAPPTTETPAAPPADAPKPPAPVLVTGKPPESPDLVKIQEPQPKNTNTPDPGEAPPKSQEGLAVRVEKLHAGTGPVDPAQVKLLAPFPAKPLAKPPAGWHLDTSGSAPPISREVELAPGSKITLTIRPHLLIPDADGANTFTISEPGYEKTLGYQQTATVGAILSTSIRQLDQDSKQLGTAIDNLQQLLTSLPKPELPPTPAPASQPEIKPTNLRRR
jgi:hypothetical protein